mmetsp:Transcript_26432/g.99388  ORF Transcript_26432/g.99388 Transcript_26432/m.99388 type:complete len:330 (-) Transcript_26432:481-1470(-)
MNRTRPRSASVADRWAARVSTTPPMARTPPTPRSERSAWLAAASGPGTSAPCLAPASPSPPALRGCSNSSASERSSSAAAASPISRWHCALRTRKWYWSGARSMHCEKARMAAATRPRSSCEAATLSHASGVANPLSIARRRPESAASTSGGDRLSRLTARWYSHSPLTAPGTGLSHSCPSWSSDPGATPWRSPPAAAAALSPAPPFPAASAWLAPAANPAASTTPLARSRSAAATSAARCCSSIASSAASRSSTARSCMPSACLTSPRASSTFRLAAGRDIGASSATPPLLPGGISSSEESGALSSTSQSAASASECHPMTWSMSARW